MVEESSQPTKHGNKILVSIFLTIKKDTILDTHGVNAKKYSNYIYNFVKLSKYVVKLVKYRLTEFES